MPEGDTLVRTAAGLRPHLVGRTVIAASARTPGPRADRLVGSTITSVETRGKHLLIAFDSGLELRSHLGMHGSWHRYAPGERWRRPPDRARLVLEVPGAVAVCFDTADLELLPIRAEPIHARLSALGPDLSADDFDEAEATRRLAASDPGRTIAEALLDQHVMAGAGNVYKSEILFIERVNPFATVGSLDQPTLARLVATARRLLRANRTPHHPHQNHHPGRPNRRPQPPLRLRQIRSPVPPLRHAHRATHPRRAAPPHVLVP